MFFTKEYTVSIVLSDIYNRPHQNLLSTLAVLIGTFAGIVDTKEESYV